MRLLVLASFFVVALSGCLGDDEPRRLSGDGKIQDGALLWDGRELVAPPLDDASEISAFIVGRGEMPVCDATNCERHVFEVHEAEDRVTVSIEWEAQDETYMSPGNYLGLPALWMDLRVEKDGMLVAEGIESGHYASVATLTDAEPGSYEAVVTAVYGTGTYQGAVTVGDAPALPVRAPSDQIPADQVWPDLVMLPPDHVRIEVPLLQEVEPVLEIVQQGCGPDELVEDQHIRCLRFAGIVGNQGPGAFEVRLDVQEALASPAMGASWEQILYGPDGSEAARSPAGPASMHPVHGHYHIAGLVETTLYAYNDATGEVGEAMGPGQKTGFCLIDGGLIDQRLPGAVPPVYGGAGCCYMLPFCVLDILSVEEFAMGVSPGWYDIYPWYRADQYVPLIDVPDGMYLLESVVNPEQTLLETNVQNNAASTMIQITGDEVLMLEWDSDAELGPHPDACWDQPRPC